MPKMKTRRAAAKRFTVTGTGEFKRNKVFHVCEFIPYFSVYLKLSTLHTIHAIQKRWKPTLLQCYCLFTMPHDR